MQYYYIRSYFIFFILFPFACAGQMQNGLYAKIHLLTPIDPQTPTFTFGAEGIIKKIGIEASYGHATHSLFSRNDGTYKKHYWELRGESRFYFYRKSMFDQKI